MVKLSLTDEEKKMFENVKWELDEDDSWWYDLICCDFEKEWVASELIESIQKDIDENLSIDEIYGKYEKKNI